MNTRRMKDQRETRPRECSVVKHVCFFCPHAMQVADDRYTPKATARASTGIGQVGDCGVAIRIHRIASEEAVWAGALPDVTALIPAQAPRSVGAACRRQRPALAPASRRWLNAAAHDHRRIIAPEISAGSTWGTPPRARRVGPPLGVMFAVATSMTAGRPHHQRPWRPEAVSTAKQCATAT